MPRRRAESASGRFEDRKSTRLNSSHLVISYAVFCLKKKITHVEQCISRIILGTLLARVCRTLSVLAAALVLASCTNQIEIAPHLRPLPRDTMMLLGK